MTTEAPFIVCPDCHGKGSHGPGFVYTQDDRDQMDPDEFEQHIEQIRAGQFDTPCTFCKGLRVVPEWEMVDGERVTAEERWKDEQDYRAEVAAEARYFGTNR